MLHHFEGKWNIENMLICSILSDGQKRLNFDMVVENTFHWSKTTQNQCIMLVRTTAQIGGGPRYASWTNIRNMLNLHLCINQNLKNIKYSSRNWLFINFESGLPIINWVVRWLVLALGTPFGQKLLFLRWIRLGVKAPANIKEKMTCPYHLKKFDFPKGIALQNSNFLKR